MQKSYNIYLIIMLMDITMHSLEIMGNVYFFFGYSRVYFLDDKKSYVVNKVCNY